MSDPLQKYLFETLSQTLTNMGELQRKFVNGFTYSTNQKNIVNLIKTSEVEKDRTLHLLIYGGTGSGKTWGILAYFWEILCTYPMVSALVLRKTEGAVKSGPFTDSKKMLDSLGIHYSARQQASGLAITLENGSVMEFKSETSLKPRGDHKSKVAHAMGGFEFSLVAMEEVSDMPTSEVADAMPGRMRQFAGDFRRVIAYLCNPPNKHHWVSNRFFGTDNEPKDPGLSTSRYRAIQCNVEGNEFAHEAYIADMDEDYAISGVGASLREGRVSASTSGIPVYGAAFSREFHTTDVELWKTFNPRFPISRCWDFGWNGNVCIILQDDPVRHQIRVFKVCFDKFVPLDMWMEHTVLQWCSDHFPGAQFQDFCDIAGNQKVGQTGLSNFDVMRAFGIRPQGKKQEIAPGVQVITRLLTQNIAGRPALLIDRTSAGELVECLEVGYCKDLHKNQLVKDGVYDHIADAFRYGMMFLRHLLASPQHLNGGLSRPKPLVQGTANRRSRV